MEIPRLSNQKRLYPTILGLANFNVSVKGLIKAGQSPGDSSNLNCSETVKTLNVIDDIVAGVITKINVANIDQANGSIDLEYAVDQYTNYYLEMRPQGAPNFSILDTLDLSLNPNKYTVSGLNTAENYYCFRLVAFDPCDNATKNSNEACSVQLSVSVGNNQDDVSWQTVSLDFGQYLVYKDNAQVLAINNIAQKSYSDQDVVCGTQYCYKVVLNENNGLESASGTVCVTAQSTLSPPGIQDISASVSGSDVDLDWNASPNMAVSAYIVSRSDDEVAYSTLDTTSDVQYTDPGLYVNSNRYYYHVRYIDLCNNTSGTGVTASPVLLSKSADGSLVWTAYLGWIQGVEGYFLEKYDRDGNLLENIPMGQSLNYTENNTVDPQQKFIYRIVARPKDSNLTEVYSNYVEIVFKSRAFFPNAFTPNGDGLNDIFNFDSKFVKAVDLFIYNRWGSLIFHTNLPEKGWDGQVDGRPAPTGTYVYRAELIDEMGVTFIQTGQVVLLR